MVEKRKCSYGRAFVSNCYEMFALYVIGLKCKLYGKYNNYYGAKNMVDKKQTLMYISLLLIVKRIVNGFIVVTNAEYDEREGQIFSLFLLDM